MQKAQYLVCAALVAVSACFQSVPQRTTRPESRDELVKEAHDKYNLEDPRPPRRDDQAPISDEGGVMGLDVSTHKMNKKWLAKSNHQWVGAIESNVPYPRLGLGKGMNYIFLLPKGDSLNRLVVVPTDVNVKPHYLKYLPYADISGGHPGPPLVIVKKSISISRPQETAFVIAGCFEGPCSSGHCSSTNVGAEY